MKPHGYLSGIHHGDVFRQIGIDVFFDFLCAFFGLQLGIGRLSIGMDPRIRPSRSMDLHFPAIQPGEDCLQFSLDGIFGVSLLLPSIIAGPFIL